MLLLCNLDDRTMEVYSIFSHWYIQKCFKSIYKMEGQPVGVAQ